MHRIPRKHCYHSDGTIDGKAIRKCQDVHLCCPEVGFMVRQIGCGFDLQQRKQQQSDSKGIGLTSEDTRQ